MHPRTVLLSAALLVLALTAPLTAQVTFQKLYGGTGVDEAMSVLQTPDQGYVFAGFTKSYGAGYEDLWLVKTDANGEEVWSRAYGGTDNDFGWSVAPTASNGYVVAGHTESFGAGRQDAWLIKVDASGDSVWSRTYGGSDDEWGCSVLQLPGGGYVLAGHTESYGAGRKDVWLVRTDSVGDTLWTRTYGGSDDDWGESVILTQDGGFAIAGYTYSYDVGGGDFWLIRTDASGDTLWTRTYGGSDWEVGYSVVQTDDGGFAVCGYTRSFGAGGLDAWLVRTDASGDTLWARTYGTAESEAGHAVAQTADGGFVVTGWNYFTQEYDDLWLFRTDASGDTLWNRTFDGLDDEQGWSVQQTADGGFVVAGHTWSYGAGNSDVWLIKTDSLGMVGIAEPEPPVGVEPARATVMPAARLRAELAQHPDLSAFEASGRQLLDPAPGVVFLRSAATTRRVLVVD